MTRSTHFWPMFPFYTPPLPPWKEAIYFLCKVRHLRCLTGFSRYASYHSNLFLKSRSTISWITFQLNPWNIIYKFSKFHFPILMFLPMHWSSHRKTPLLESLFKNIAGLKACNFINERLQHRCFPDNIVKFLRTSILKNICEGLLLNVQKEIKHKLKLLRPKKNNTLVSGNAVDEKNLHRDGRKKNFFISLIEFFKQSLHLKNYSNSSFLFWKTKSPIFYCLKG